MASVDSRSTFFKKLLLTHLGPDDVAHDLGQQQQEPDERGQQHPSLPGAPGVLGRIVR